MKKRKKIRLSQEGLNAQTAMKRAVAKVIADHRAKKIPIAIWKNNRVIEIQP